MDALSSGRELARLGETTTGEDLLFASERLDGVLIAGRQIRHSTLTHLSFLRATFEHSTFLNCTFVDCYFRETKISKSSFVGCRFIDCVFEHTKVQTSDFRYARFSGSALPYKEMQYSGPSEPNLSQALFEELGRAAATAGASDDARSYRLAAIKARNAHLVGAVKAESDWYKEHYPIDRRIGAGLTLVWHWFNRVLWKHGESAWRMFINALLAALVVFPVLLFADRGSAGAGVTFGDSIWFSVSNFLLLDRLSPLAAGSAYLQAISALEALSGIVFAGLFVTLVVKALLRR